jgi:hypothetical protein
VSTSKQSLGVSGRGIIQSFRHPGPGRSSAEPSPLIDGDRAWHGTAGRPHLSPSPSPRGQRRTRAVVIALPTGECGPRRYSDKAPGPTRHGRRGARAAAAMPHFEKTQGCRLIVNSSSIIGRAGGGSPDQAKPCLPFSSFNSFHGGGSRSGSPPCRLSQPYVRAQH